MPQHKCVDVLCGKAFVSPSKLQQHIDAVHLGLKPHACSHCEATFAQAGDLKRHMSSVHLGLKPHACSQCEATFTEAGSLRKHVSAVHLGLKKHACSQCEATFAQAVNLKKHVSSVHLGLKPHACSQCDATFTEAGNLKKHVASVHLGLKPHACSLCEATFAQAGDLKSHVSSVHLGLKPHACSQCDATFAQANKLRQHVSAVHLGLKPHACSHCGETFAWKMSLDNHHFYEHTEEGKRYKNDVDHAKKNGYSLQSIKYFDIINKRLDIFIQHARNGGEHKIRVEGRGWRADGYMEEYDTVIEFMGCYFHGCPDCVPNKEQIIYGETAQKKYDDTQFRLAKIREKYANVIVVWEHEFAEMLDDEETLEDHLLDYKILLGLPIDLPPIKRQREITDFFQQEPSSKRPRLASPELEELS